MIYFAGALFSKGELSFNRELSDYISLYTGETIALPQHFCSVVQTSEEIFTLCKSILGNSRVVVAILDGTDTDSGTSWEIGYAYSRNIPVIGIRTDFRKHGDDGFLNAMISCSLTELLVFDSDDTVKIIAESIVSSINSIEPVANTPVLRILTSNIP